MTTVDRARETELLEKWAKDRKGFVRDGVVDADHYEGILFLLKEVNDPGQNDWSLVKLLQNGGLAPTWNNVARWTYGLLQKPAYPDFKDVPLATTGFRQEWLRKIAVVNLKKTGGGGSSKRSELEKAVGDRRKQLREQLALYHPKITVCGGTFGFLPLLYDESELRSPIKTSDVWYYDTKVIGLVLNCYHPQARLRAEHLYSKLIDAVKEIRGPEKN